MGDCCVEVRDKHGRLLTKVSEAILIQFLSVMECYASRMDPPRVRICEGDGCCYPVRSVRDFERYLYKTHTRSWCIVLADQPPDAENQLESRLAALLFDVPPPPSAPAAHSAAKGTAETPRLDTLAPLEHL